MALALGPAWWRCCKCKRECQKVLGDERCPDCEHFKCDDCEDPCDRPNDWADLSATLPCHLVFFDDTAGSTPSDESQSSENTAAVCLPQPKEASGISQKGSPVNSDLSLK